MDGLLTELNNIINNEDELFCSIEREDKLTVDFDVYEQLRLTKENRFLKTWTYRDILYKYR